MSASVAKERQINFYPSPALKEKIEKYAREHNMTKSAVAKEALQLFFSKEEKVKKAL